MNCIKLFLLFDGLDAILTGKVTETKNYFFIHKSL